MFATHHVTDRRFAQRENVRLNAHVKVLGRARIPCVVHNISSTGAMVELGIDLALPETFRLDIDGDLFEATCEVRHRDGRRYGLLFTSNLQAALAKYS